MDYIYIYPGYIYLSLSSLAYLFSHSFKSLLHLFIYVCGRESQREIHRNHPIYDFYSVSPGDQTQLSVLALSTLTN